MISYALPRYRPAVSFTLPHNRIIFCTNDNGGGFCEPVFDYSKARLAAVRSLAKRGMSRFLETISKRKSNSRVFLLRRTPSYRYCFYLYIAM
jgi:hypothetical protein